MEATELKPETRTRVTNADRELGYRLGAVILRCMSGDGGGALRVLDESGLTFTQMKALLTISGDRAEPATVKAISDELGLSLASVSRAVDGIVKRGLAVRAEDDRDRRVRRLSLTPEGQELSDRILVARLEGLGRFAASLSEEERERLDEALSLLLERDEIADLYRQYRRRGRK